MSSLEAKKIWRKKEHRFINHQNEPRRYNTIPSAGAAERSRIGLEGGRERGGGACLGEGRVGEADADVGAVALGRRVHGCDGDERGGRAGGGARRAAGGSGEAERGGGRGAAVVDEGEGQGLYSEAACGCGRHHHHLALALDGPSFPGRFHSIPFHG